MNKKYLIAVPVIAAIFIAGLLIPTGFESSSAEEESIQETYHAEITKLVDENIVEGETFIQTLELEFSNGRLEGEKTIITNDESYKVSHRVFKEGDKVIVTHLIGQDIFYIADYVRSNSILILFILFVLVVLLVTGLQGVGAILGMGLSFILLFKLVLPLILGGTSPVLAAIVGAVFIIPLTFYSSHGFNRKTTVAVIGTLLTLIIAGLLGTL